MHKIPLSSLPIRCTSATDPPHFIHSTSPYVIDILHNTICIAIVGSRRPTEYGKRATYEIVQALKDLPCSIISGMAYGIDSYALQAASDIGLPCIGVPGSGIEPHVIYPRASQKLGDTIQKTGGALITAFDPTAQSKPWMFPARNKLMALLCHATVIVEADYKSGSLITAFHALEFNRDIFTVPGSIFSDLSRGANNLLKQGAMPIINPRTLYKYVIEHPCNTQRNVQRGAIRMQIDGENVTSNQSTTSPTSVPTLKQHILTHIQNNSCSQTSLWNILREQKIACTHEQFCDILIELEMSGDIEQRAGLFTYINT